MTWSSSISEQTLHTCKLHDVTHVWEIYNVKEGEERVARVTNDPLLSLGVRVSPVITETKSSPTFICKNEEKEMFLCLSFLYIQMVGIVWPKPLCSKTDFCFVNLR